MLCLPPCSTLFPYTTLFRSGLARAPAEFRHRRGRRAGIRRLAGRCAGPSRRLRPGPLGLARSEEHTSELQSRRELVCRLLLEKKKTYNSITQLISVDIRVLT